MKKLLAIMAVVGFAACNNGENKDAAADTTKTDTTVTMMDTTHMDTTHMMDTTHADTTHK